NVSGEVLPILQEPVHALAKAGQLAQHLFFQDLDRKERHEANQGADTQGELAPIDEQLVVVKAVFLIPQPCASQRIDGVGNRHEVLEEFGGNVLIGVVVVCQLEGDGQHRGAVKTHPGGAVGLCQLSSGGQGL